MTSGAQCDWLGVGLTELLALLWVKVCVYSNGVSRTWASEFSLLRLSNLKLFVSIFKNVNFFSVDL